MAARLLPQNNRKCAIPECSTHGSVRAGFCNLHYRRWRRHGDPLGGGPSKGTNRSAKPKSPCRIEGCGRPTKAQQFCSAHYGRFKKYGDPIGGGPMRLPWAEQVKRRCEIDGCEKWSTTRRLCPAHYQRWRNHGDPEVGGAILTRQNIGGKRISNLGYVVWFDPSHPSSTKNGTVHEHRAVMSEIIGRPLLPSENVHHRNGDRAHNSPENLELWVTKQPAGQRPADLVSWAKEILRTYPDELLSRLEAA